jgi:hypothetical protein
VKDGARIEHKWCMNLEKLNFSLTVPALSAMLAAR